MSGAFSFSDNETATFPDNCQPAVQVWNEMTMTLRFSEEVGVGECLPDGRVKIKYAAFEIMLNPDGTFSGRRSTESMAVSMLRVPVVSGGGEVKREKAHADA